MFRILCPARVPDRRACRTAVWLSASAVAGVLTVPLAATAQQSIVVVASREPLPADRIGADVVVIDRAVIEASSADSLADLLRREAGVQVSRNGGPGQSSGVLLRGAAAVNTVVMVDGVRVGSATLGFAQLEALPLAQIERVEVLRGPASSLVGADAVGGVVQVFTRQGAAPRLEARAGAGGYGTRDASVAWTGAAPGWQWTLSAAGEASRGVSALRAGDLFGSHNPDLDGHRLSALQGRLAWQPAEGHRVEAHASGTRLNAQYDASEYAPPTYAPDNTPDFRNRLRTSTQGVQWRGPFAGGVSGLLRWGRSLDDLVSGGMLLDHYRTQREHLTAQASALLGAAGTAVVALEHLREEASSNAYAQPEQRRSTALALAWSGRAAAADWQADLRRDERSDVDPVTTGRVAMSWPLAAGWRWRAVAGTTFRAPSFNDLYFPGYGVATLRPERGRSTEAGLQWSTPTAQASLVVFRNRVQDLIGYESDASRCPPDPSYLFGCARNIGRATLQGATLAGTLESGPWALRSSMDWLDARDDDSGARLNRRAAWQGQVTVAWRQAAWTLGASLLGVGARPDGGATLPREVTLDLSSDWRFSPGWTLTARLRNATDETLTPARDYQGLGRHAWVGLRYEGAGL